jgi:hypothetical protein
MQMIIFGTMLAAVLSAASASSLAQGSRLSTGNELYEDYEEWKKIHDGRDGEAISFGFFMGFVSGAVDVDAARVKSGGKRYQCPPEGVRYEQYLDVVGRYLEMHPDQLHRATLVYEALAQAWPCPQEQG